MILVMVMLLTWMIPAGHFERVSMAGGKEIVVAGSYQTGESSPQDIWDLLKAPFRGFKEAAGIIAFVLIAGGAFALVMSTGAIDAALVYLIKKSGGSRSRKLLMVTVLIFLFSLCGFTFGMSEESLVFVLFSIPMARNMGYDTIVGVAIPFVSSGIGGSAAAYNPFSVGVAMDIAGLPFPSGVVERTVIWLILTVAVAAFILRYACMIEKNPSKSLVHGIMNSSTAESPEVNKPDVIGIIIISAFLLTLIVIPIGSSYFGWGMEEIGAMFLALGILSALIKRQPASGISKNFVQGAQSMLTAAIVIGLSRSVLVIARDGMIIDTILFHLSGLIGGMPSIASIQVMFAVQGIINFFIPSGSGQAAITMPVMAPLADLTGISRQSAVMAFQLAAGYFDLVIPTSGVTMGVLSLAGIPYSIWMKWIFRLMIILVLIAMIALAFLVSTGF